jgi:hypothetical protein
MFPAPREDGFSGLYDVSGRPQGGDKSKGILLRGDSDFLVRIILGSSASNLGEIQIGSEIDRLYDEIRLKLRPIKA